MAGMEKTHDTISLRVTKDERQALEDYRAANGLRSLNAAMCHLASSAAATAAAMAQMSRALAPFAELVDMDPGDDDPVPPRGSVHCLIMGLDELGSLDCADFHAASAARKLVKS